MKVRYTPKALAQLEQIYSYIEAHNATAANRIKTRPRQAIERLGRHPYSCRASEHPGIRVLSIVRYPYLVFCSVDEGAQEVHVLRVRHSAQDPRRHLD